MKKTLIIFGLILVSVVGYSQSEDLLPMKGTSAATDTFRVIKDGSSALMLKSTIFQETVDTSAAQRASILLNDAELSALSDSVDNQRTDMTAMSVLIAGNTADISANALDILQNISDISDNSDSVTVHRDQLISILSSLVALDTRVKVLEGGKGTTAVLELSYDFTDSLDATANNRDFTPSDDFSFIYEESRAGTGLFDTVTKHVTSPVIEHTANFTAMADVVIGNDSTGQRFVMGNMVSNDGWELRVNYDTKRILMVTGSGGSLDSIYTAADIFRVDTVFPHKIFRVAVTSTGLIYIDGQLKSVSGSFNSGLHTSSSIRIGVDKAGTSVLHGYVDNVKIYRGVVTATEIANEYAGNEYFYNPNFDLAPTIASGNVTTNPRIINLQASERIYNIKDSLMAAFIPRINGGAVSVDSFEHGPQSLSLYIDDTVQANNVVTIAYDADYYSGLEDFRGNKMADFTGLSITNNIEEIDSVSAAEWHYLFNGDNSDNSENNNAWTDNGVDFSSATKVEGTHSMWMTASSAHVTTPTMANVDTISFGGWINTSWSEQNNRQVFYFDATTYLELDLLSDRIVFSGNSAEAQATGITTMNDGTWHHYWVQHSTNSGDTEIYYDGAEVTTDPSAGIGADFSGQWNIGEDVTGWFDDWSCYYDRWLTEAKIDSLKNNPGAYILKSGSGTAPAPIADTAWSEVATTLMFLDFDNWSPGEYTKARIRTDLVGDPNTELLYEGGTMWTIYPPVLKDYAYDSAGTVKHSNGLFMRQLQGNDNSIQLPGHANHGLPRNEDADEVWLGFYMGYTGSLWDELEATTKREWKTNGVWAGIFPETVPPGTGSAVMTATVPGRPNAKMKYKVMGKSNEWNSKATRFFSYLDSDPYDYEEEFPATIPDPDDLTNSFYLYHSAADSQRVHITHHIYLGTPNTPDAFVETFIDGKFAWRAEGFVGRDQANIVVDMFNLSYFWGGGSDDFPPNEDAEIWYDDIEVWIYKESHRAKGRKSVEGEQILLRNFNAATGEKK